MLNHKKPRLPRIERTNQTAIHDDTTHLWAVSYADFLMVLLCFFILFFSVDGAKKESLIQKISASIAPNPHATGDQAGGAGGRGKPGDVAGGAGGAGNSTGAAGGDPGGDKVRVQALFKAPDEIFRDLRVSASAKEEKLILYFPEDIFHKGSIKLPKEMQHVLEGVMQRLTPFMADIQLTFVGHTDPTPMHRSRRGVINDNFDLSSMRATKALQHVVRLGYSPENMSAQGAAEHARGSRSLSLIISLREGRQ